MSHAQNNENNEHCHPTLPELRFPLLTDEYRRPIHPEIEDYMRRYISNDQDWDQVDDEDCWGIRVNYTEPTTQIRGKIETILHISGEEQPDSEHDVITKSIPERESFSVPHASRDPKILQDVNLENEDIFDLIKNPPEVGAVRIFEQAEFWDSTIGSHPCTTQGIATIHLPSGRLKSTFFYKSRLQPTEFIFFAAPFLPQNRKSVFFFLC